MTCIASLKLRATRLSSSKALRWVGGVHPELGSTTYRLGGAGLSRPQIRNGPGGHHRPSGRGEKRERDNLPNGKDHEAMELLFGGGGRDRVVCFGWFHFCGQGVVHRSFCSATQFP